MPQWICLNVDLRWISLQGQSQVKVQNADSKQFLTICWLKTLDLTQKIPSVFIIFVDFQLNSAKSVFFTKKLNCERRYMGVECSEGAKIFFLNPKYVEDVPKKFW